MIRYNQAPRSMRMAIEYYCRKQSGKDFLDICIEDNAKVSEMFNFSQTEEGTKWWFDECERIELILSPCVN